jgi:hypothetical protein
MCRAPKGHGKSPLASRSPAQCFAILAPFDILKEMADVNFEWFEVVRDFQTAEAREMKLLAENLS